MNNPISLIFVDINDGTKKKMTAKQSNKFYNMIDNGDGTFTSTWGRVGMTSSSQTYPISKWNSTLNQKLRKGYTDVSHLKTVVTEEKEYKSINPDFDLFFNKFSAYAKLSTKRSYLVDAATPLQIKEAQSIIDHITTLSSLDTINKTLLELYKVIPRRMDNVNNYLISKPAELNNIIQREQDALDGMDSTTIIAVQKTTQDLDIQFKLCNDTDILAKLDKLIMSTNSHKYKIHKVYEVSIPARRSKFDNWVSQQTNKNCELLIHGTRNANIFSILKSGLLIRPSNAAMISGAAYGNGIYHSAHTDKSLGYTGYDPDKIFLIQNVHMGNPFTYNGWYRGNSFPLKYDELKKRGFDSTYVKPDGRLRNSEYIVYKEDQSDTSYVVWMK